MLLRTTACTCVQSHAHAHTHAHAEAHAHCVSSFPENTCRCSWFFNVGLNHESVLERNSLKIIFLRWLLGTMVQNKKKQEKKAIQSLTVPRAREWAKWASKQTSERSGARKQSEQGRASKHVGGASKWANRLVALYFSLYSWQFWTKVHVDLRTSYPNHLSKID